MLTAAMPQDRPNIFIIDDDASVRRAIGRVMTFAGHEWNAYASVEDFVASAQLHVSGCIVADMTMIGMSGLDLKHLLNAADSHLPVIFLTAHDTDELRAAAHAAGAAGYFRKPVDTQALLDAVQWALNEQTAKHPV